MHMLLYCLYVHAYHLCMCMSASSSLAVGEDVVLNWVNPIQTERHWRSTVIMACHTSPHLAFQLTNR